MPFCLAYRCGNVAAILELDEHLQRDFTIFEAAPQVRFIVILLYTVVIICDFPSGTCLFLHFEL